MNDNSPRRMCSLCGAGYTDQTGHDYAQCVEDLERRVLRLMRELDEAEKNLIRAVIRARAYAARKETR